MKEAYCLDAWKRWLHFLFWWGKYHRHLKLYLPFEGNETGETGCLGKKEVSNQSHEIGETASRASGKESNSVASPDLADANGGEPDLVGEAIKQLKGGK